MSRIRFVWPTIIAMALLEAMVSAAAGDGRAVLERAGVFYEGLPAVRATMEIRMELPPGLPAMAKMEPMRYEVTVARPARVAAFSDDAAHSPSFVQDGVKQYASFPPLKRYLLQEATPSLEDLLDESKGSALMVPGLDLMLGFGLGADAPGSLRGAEKVEARGEEAVDGVDCHHLVLSGNGREAEVWIARGEEPWVMRYRLDPPGGAAEEEINLGAGVIQFEPGLDLRFRNWSANPDLEGAFPIDPPEGFERAETLFPSEGEMGELVMDGGSSLFGNHPSIGKPAPAARLEPLDGEATELVSLRGKVVVLDFWATWCVPCIAELPLVGKVTAELADRGVVFYSVNRGDSEKVVRSFLKKKNISVPVVLDAEDSISSAFGVDGIPHLTIIDRAGTVKNVHIGAGPGSERQLKAELEALVGSE